MAKYFIEARIIGRMKYDIRSITGFAKRQCRLPASKCVPHITIVYDCTPINTRRDERKLISRFVDVCSRYGHMEFKFEGFGNFANTGVAKINIQAPPEMHRLRWDLISQLRDFCRVNRVFDINRGDWSPHVTIAMKLNKAKLNEVMSCLRKSSPPQGHYYLARTTLLKRGRILSEYDFFLRRSLNRSEALNKKIMQQTLGSIGEAINEKRKFTFIQKVSRLLSLPIRLLKQIFGKK